MPNIVNSKVGPVKAIKMEESSTNVVSQVCLIVLGIAMTLLGQV